MKKLQFFGAAGTVTGSCHLLVGDNDRGVLVDMGMFQGPERIQKMNFVIPTFNATQIDSVFLTHAHLDHCGRLPLLAKMGFTGEIYMTAATRELTELVLFDSAKIAAMDKDIDPLYSDSHVEQILERARIVKYDEPFKSGNYEVTYKDAGHLLGSAFIEIVDTNSSSQTKRIVFSGDLGNTPDQLLSPTKKTDSADVVVIESTYGDKNHPGDDPHKDLQREVNMVEKAGSTLMIPAFSLERTQIILYMLKNLKRQKKIDVRTPVFLDSPMGIEATEIYGRYSHLFNSRLRNEFIKGDPFSFPSLIVTRSHKQSKGIENIAGPKVIIAGSGMMTGGRIVGHAKRHLSNEANRLLIVGYQGEETLGREIQEGATEVEIDDETIPVNASVSIVRNLSAHADQKRLLSWLGGMEDVKRAILVHGDDGGPREALADRFRSDLKINDVQLPQLYDEIYL